MLVKYLSGLSVRAKSIALLAGSNVIAQAVTMAAMPIASRLYKPEEFGYAAVYLAGVGMVVVIANGRYEMAIPLPKEGRAGLSLVCLCLVLSLVMTAIAAVGIVFFGDSLTSWTRSVPLRPYLWIAPLAILGAAVYQTFSGWAVREGAYSRIAQTRLLQNTSGALVLLGVGAFLAGPLGLLLSDLATRVTGIVRLGQPLWKSRGSIRKDEASVGTLAVARKYREFPLYSAPGALLNTASLLAPPLLLASSYGAETAGQFSMSLRVMMVPMVLLGTSASQVFVSEASRMMREDVQEIDNLIKSIVRKLLAIGLAVLLLAPLLPWLFDTILGDRWRTAGIYAAWLTLCCVPQLVTSPISGIVFVAQEQKIQLRLDIVRCVGILAVLSITPLLKFPAWVAVALFSIMMGLIYGASLVLYMKIAARMQHGRT